MSKIRYIESELFEAYDYFNGENDEDCYLMHACNAQGGWGAGIAKEFAKKYPKSYEEYKDFCAEVGNATGQTLVTSENIICLITSEFYGRKKDPPEIITINTMKAVHDLLIQFPTRNMNIFLPKINSGLFGVDWKATEFILKEYSVYNMMWNVCTPPAANNTRF